MIPFSRIADKKWQMGGLNLFSALEIEGLGSILSSCLTLNVYASEMPGSLEVEAETRFSAYNKESSLDSIEF